MAFLDLSTAQRQMRVLREKGELSPVKFFFESWNDWDKGKYLALSKGCTVLLGGEPNHGKSQVTKELVLQHIEGHNGKVALFCTEDGEISKLFSIYCGMIMGKPYSKIRSDGKINNFAMTDDEATEAEYLLLQNLYIFKIDRKDSKYQTLDNIYNELEKAENHNNIKFTMLVIDPVYDIDDFEPKADEVLRVLNRFNMECEASQRTDIMVNHVSETAKTVNQKTGERKKLLALADEFYGGKNNSRKAMLQILVNRPKPNDDPDIGAIIKENQTDIHILKIKPEGVAKWGTYSIYYDWRSRRYYEILDDEKGYREQFATCTKFFDRKPNGEIDIKKITASPQEAFNTDEDDEFEF